MRVTSEFWVAAYTRRCFAEGAFAGLRRKGAAGAGAIFIVIDRLDSTYDFYGPAPQSFFAEEKPLDREFECLMEKKSREEIETKLEREERMDPDFWVVEVEDKEARCFLTLPKELGPDDLFSRF
ncbi:DUF1491 family protein [Pseudovibrio sp. Tun.PSC04-5.I4]|uniref:DUF1491 family protein n=1 Tax=Pseudovibrio sp. Tun.PSC04-5.I4 TaxID=1798213 RepID=UPI0008818931|nr:DUF1491 family protein [Pseudovibrio sp. Tun.PSC04-5.I4]SDQ88503.1 hypothetical protein SAMN04515695_1769 [Pseudovibrio sp. Tun.PSC04-5.I4]